MILVKIISYVNNFYVSQTRVELKINSLQRDNMGRFGYSTLVLAGELD